MKKLDWFETELLAARPVLMSYAMSLYRGNKTDAEEAQQATLCRALEYRDTFKRGTVMIAWLTVIMRNAFRNRFRFGDAKRIEYTDDDRYSDGLVSSDNPERALIAKESFEEVFNLPEKLFGIVMARGVGMTLEECVAAFGLPIGTIKSRTHRGRKLLADAVGAI